MANLRAYLGLCVASVLCMLVETAPAVEPQIANGTHHIVALGADGAVWTWGDNLFGQLGDGTETSRHLPARISGIDDVVSIAAAPTTTLAARSDGTVWQWGNFSNLLDNYEVPVQIAGLTDVVSVATTGWFSLALKRDGTVWGWGNNGQGQLGDGTRITAGKWRDPVKVSNLTGVVAIKACYGPTAEFALALRADGTVWQWGVIPGETNPEAFTATPVQVSSLSNVKQIACGTGYALALREDGTVWAWGRNGWGQLGDGTLTSRITALQVPAVSNVISIAAGYNASYALTSDGKLWAWGGWPVPGGYGFLADGTIVNHSIAGPTVIDAITNVQMLAPSPFGANMAVLQRDGTIVTWGNGPVISRGPVRNIRPIVARGLNGVTSFALGDTHAIARKNDGSVWTWGLNAFGQLGDGTLVQRSRPEQIAAIANTVKVDAGSLHSIALDADGSVWAWGSNTFGQTATAGGPFQAAPARVTALSDITAIAAGGAHNLALQQDGTVWAWGRNNAGQLGDNSGTDRVEPVKVANLSNVVAIAAGTAHSLALTSSGALYAWGYNFYGQVGDNTVTNRMAPVQIAAPAGITAIAAGLIHSFAVTSTGDLYAWGGNSDGQLGGGITNNKLAPTRNTSISGAVGVSSASEHTLMLKNDGNIWGWGRSNSGELDWEDPYSSVERALSSSGDFVAVAAGPYNSAGLKSDGTVWVWGDDTFGQLGRSFRRSYWIPATVSTSADSLAPLNLTVPAPPPISFVSQTGVLFNTTVTSNAIAVSGMNGAASIAISGGTYSVNGGAYMSASGSVNDGDSVTVRVTSAAGPDSPTCATLTIGTVTGNYCVTTRSAPPEDPVTNDPTTSTPTTPSNPSNPIFRVPSGETSTQKRTIDLMTPILRMLLDD